MSDYFESGCYITAVFPDGTVDADDTCYSKHAEAQRQGRVRMSAFAKRKQRYIRLKRLQANLGNVMRAAGNPAVQYGARDLGMVPSVVAKRRSTLVLGLPDGAKSASVTLQYKFCEKDH